MNSYYIKKKLQIKFAAALLAATATATCSFPKSSQCMDTTYLWYVASGSYAGCMTTLGCAKYIDADKKATDEARNLNLFDFTAEIDVDGQYARNCTVNCANRTTYETSNGAVYQNLAGSAAWCSSVYPDTSSKKYLLCTGEYWGLQ